MVIYFYFCWSMFWVFFDLKSVVERNLQTKLVFKRISENILKLYEISPSKAKG